MRRIAAIVLAAALLFNGCGSSQAEVTALSAEVETLEASVRQLEGQLGEQETLREAQDNRIDSLNNQIAEYQMEIAKLNELLDQAAPWFELEEAEQERRIAELEAEREAERQAREAQEKLGYDTGITYSQLARTPDDYKGQMVKFYGQVAQVIEGGYSNAIRLAVNGNYDNIIYCTYSKSLVDSRILEYDYITIYGTAEGLQSYQTVMGNTLTIPKVSVDKIDQ